MRRRGWIGTTASSVVLAGTLAACTPGNVFSLGVGTCFDDVAAFLDEGGGEIDDVPIVECAEPHDNEVFATFDIEGEDFPGDEVVLAAATDGCVSRFDGYVGRDYPSSRFASSHLVPTRDSWDLQDDREVVCFLYDMGLEPIEGTARDSGE